MSVLCAMMNIKIGWGLCHKELTNLKKKLVKQTSIPVKTWWKNC